MRQLSETSLSVVLGGNGFCAIRGRSHKSNRAFLEIEPANQRFRQRCFDSDCRGASPWFSLKQEAAIAGDEHSEASREPEALPNTPSILLAPGPEEIAAAEGLAVEEDAALDAAEAKPAGPELGAVPEAIAAAAETVCGPATSATLGAESVFHVPCRLQTRSYPLSSDLLLKKLAVASFCCVRKLVAFC